MQIKRWTNTCPPCDCPKCGNRIPSVGGSHAPWAQGEQPSAARWPPVQVNMYIPWVQPTPPLKCYSTGTRVAGPQGDKQGHSGGCVRYWEREATGCSPPGQRRNRPGCALSTPLLRSCRNNKRDFLSATWVDFVNKALSENIWSHDTYSSIPFL